MSFIDASGQTVPSHIAIDASGNLRSGYRRASAVMENGDRIGFDAMFADAKPAANSVFLKDDLPPRAFVSPAEARQAEILADVARSSAARQILRDAYIGEQVDAVAASRSAGTGCPIGAALRDAHYEGAALAQAAPTISLADNSQAVSAIRAARYI